jgi:bacillithiol biosynthesis cysteine-adding enzyme BshC
METLLNETANASSSSVAGPAESVQDDPAVTAPATGPAVGSSVDLTVDLAETGLLPPLPAAYLAGSDRDLLDPLRFLPPDRMPEGAAPPVDRGELARALAVANQSYGHPRAEELAARLADPAVRVVVSGQQPGLFGGPLYTLSKMVAAHRWAEELTAAGLPAVAVFWVATEDHDWDEVARTTMLTRKGPWTLDLGDDPHPLMPVGMRSLGDGLEHLYERLAEGGHGERFDDWLDTVARFYRPDARFGEAFCRLMVEILGEATPLLLDSMLAEAKSAQRPVLRKLVEERWEVEEAYAAADSEIEGRGYDLQVQPQRGASPLFQLHRGERRRIEWRGEDRWALRGLDGVGGTVDELLASVEDNPAAVSAGVLARPAVQDALLGTFLHVVGPGEMSYLAQAAPAYRVLEVEAPWVVFRPQALVLESHRLEQLEGTGLALADLFAPEEELERRLAARAGENPVTTAKERVRAALEDLKTPALEIDAHLERPWEKTRDQVLRGLETFEGKVTSAMARQDEIRHRRVDRLRDACLPDGRLQERVVSCAYFPGKYRDRFVESFLDQVGLDPRSLQVVVI